MYRLTIPAVLFFLLLRPILGQGRVSFEIENNSALQKNEILSVVESFNFINSGKNTRDSVTAMLLTELQNQGYFRAKVEIGIGGSDSGITTVKILIDAGKRAIIGRVHCNYTDSSATSDLLERFKFLAGKEMSVQIITDEINTALKTLENRGHPFAKFTINQVEYLDSLNSVYADLKFEPGRKCQIDRMIVTGNTVTKEFVILRHLRFTAGQPYVQKQIDKIPERLNRLKLFQEIAEPAYFVDRSDKGILRIEIKEKNNNTFDGIIGYNPGNVSGEKGYVTGMVNVQFRNLFGTGRAAAVRWQKLDRHSSELELQYTEPWILDYPVSIETRFYQRQQDTTYVAREFSGVLDFAATDEVSVGLQFGTQQVIPSLLTNNVFTVYNSTAISTGLRVRIDTRDDPLVPHRGLYFSNSYLFTSKTINGPAEFIYSTTKKKSEQQKLILDIAGFNEIFNGQVITLSFHGRELRGNMLESSDFFKMGGANTMRGYRENQFIGQRIAWSNLEYRFMLEQRSYAYLFLDNGYHYQAENSSLKLEKSEAAHMGYGLGLTFQSGLGLMNVSYALGKGATFSQGLIHFGLVNEF